MGSSNLLKNYFIETIEIFYIVPLKGISCSDLIRFELYTRNNQGAVKGGFFLKAFFGFIAK